MHLLHTIGYEGSTIEDFVETLVQSRISMLIDVRDFPGSRKKGFSKNRLAMHLADVGIYYRHLKGLGDPKPGREAARAGKMDTFRRIFFAHMETPAALADLDEATKLATSESACLFCYERDHHDCHRSIVAGRIIKQTGIDVKHLGVRHGISVMKTSSKRIIDDIHAPAVW